MRFACGTQAVPRLVSSGFGCLPHSLVIFPVRVGEKAARSRELGLDPLTRATKLARELTVGKSCEMSMAGRVGADLEASLGNGAQRVPIHRRNLIVVAGRPGRQLGHRQRTSVGREIRAGEDRSRDLESLQNGQHRLEVSVRVVERHVQHAPAGREGLFGSYRSIASTEKASHLSFEGGRTDSQRVGPRITDGVVTEDELLEPGPATTSPLWWLHGADASYGVSVLQKASLSSRVL